uniref:Uncharacterized protein n=1 Tax=Romanomermis culicivorax TaxID=13658 RepID=A0A915KMA3_ROMCU
MPCLNELLVELIFVEQGLKAIKLFSGLKERNFKEKMLDEGDFELDQDDYTSALTPEIRNRTSKCVEVALIQCVIIGKGSTAAAVVDGDDEDDDAVLNVEDAPTRR